MPVYPAAFTLTADPACHEPRENRPGDAPRPAKRRVLSPSAGPDQRPTTDRTPRQTPLRPSRQRTRSVPASPNPAHSDHPLTYLDLALTIAPPTGGGAKTSA